MFGKILLDVFLIILYGIGILIAFGFLNELFIRLFTKVLGPSSYKVQIVTGAIGTPVHEAGHALFCLIFAHKITAIKLYDPSPENGVMGYVRHSYNEKNFYQVIGNFFIGIGPLVLGSLVLLGLFALMVNDSFQNIAFIISLRAAGKASFLSLFMVLGDVFVEVFSVANLGNVLWWLFMIIACPIALHMNLSASDIKGGWQGLLFTVGLLAVVSIIVGAVSFTALESFTHAMFIYALYQIAFASFAVIAFFVMLVIALGVRLFKKKVLKKA